MIRRTKTLREERRRQHVEVNLLKPDPEPGTTAKARKGCTLPFLSGGLLFIAFEIARSALG